LLRVVAQRVGPFALLCVASHSFASGWVGAMSCGELLVDAKDSVRAQPFTGPVRMAIDGGRAILDRDWATGQERIVGPLLPDRKIRLEGLGWFNGNRNGSWTTRAELVPSAAGYEGTSTLESSDGRTIYRRCTISLAPSPDARPDGAQARRSSPAPGDSSLARPTGEQSRSPGTQRVAAIDPVWQELDCANKVRPHIAVEGYEATPGRLRSGAEINVRLTYAFCGRNREDEATGRLSRRVLRRGQVVFEDVETQFVVRAGRWNVDASIRFPANAGAGEYVIESRWVARGVRFERRQSVTVLPPA
jgi:hypothetical protein